MSAHPPAAIPQTPDARLARRQALPNCAIIRNIAFYYAGWVSEDGRERRRCRAEFEGIRFGGAEHFPSDAG